MALTQFCLKSFLCILVVCLYHRFDNQIKFTWSWKDIQLYRIWIYKFSFFSIFYHNSFGYYMAFRRVMEWMDSSWFHVLLYLHSLHNESVVSNVHGNKWYYGNSCACISMIKWESHSFFWRRLAVFVNLCIRMPYVLFFSVPILWYDVRMSLYDKIVDEEGLIIIPWIWFFDFWMCNFLSIGLLLDKSIVSFYQTKRER